MLSFYLFLLLRFFLSKFQSQIQIIVEVLVQEL